jgi:hypothetical protein
MIRGHHFMLNGKSVPLALALPLILILSWGRPAIADDAIDKVRALLVRYPHSGADLLSQIDRDGNGIDQKEIDRANRVLAARIRAKNISERLIYDLNNDFEVTRSEVEQVADYDREPILLGDDKDAQDAQAAKQKRHSEEVVAEVMQGDANGNGKLDWLEISESLRMSDIDNQFEIFSVMLAQALLNADPNKDGIMTSAESTAILNLAVLKKAEK